MSAVGRSCFNRAKHAWSKGASPLQALNTEKPRVLAACPAAAFPRLRRILGRYVQLIAVDRLWIAQELLDGMPELCLVICGVHFDESRMYELLQYSRRRRPDLPFLCVRMLDSPRRLGADEIAVSAKALGAMDVIDFAGISRELGARAAEQRLALAVRACLPRPVASA
jgi:hypothetical protein